jgi:hypothetical protein
MSRGTRWRGWCEGPAGVAGRGPRRGACGRSWWWVSLLPDGQLPLAPGADVLRFDVLTFLDAAGIGFAKGTLGQLGLEGLGELAKHAATGIIGDLAVPAVGAYRGGRRTSA